METPSEWQPPAMDSIFKSAIQQFEAGLPEKEKAAFTAVTSPCQMMDLLKAHISGLKTNKESRLLKACTKIEALGNTLEPYFEIIGIFVSSHPDLAAIFWGG